MTALDAGIAFIPATVVALFVNPLAGVLVDKVGARAVCITSSVFLTVGAASFIFVGPGTPLWVLTLLQGVRAVGVSGLVGPLNSYGLSGTSLMMLIVTVVGAALAVADPAAAGAAAVDGGASLSALPYQLAFALSTLFAAAVLVTALWKIR